MTPYRPIYVRTAHGTKTHFLFPENHQRTYCGQRRGLVLTPRPTMEQVCWHCDRYASLGRAPVVVCNIQEEPPI